MVEAVGCITSATASCAKTDVALQDVVSATDFGSTQQDLFQDMARRAIARAVEEPVGGGPVAPRRADLTATAGNEVAERKSDLMSSVARPGTEPFTAPATADGAAGSTPADQMEQVSERIKSLYVQLTEYHVAWKVGHKVQQDISQILRGQ